MYLEKVQKVFKVIGVFAKVFMILSYVCGGLAIAFGIFALAGTGEVLFKIGSVNIIAPIIVDTTENIKPECVAAIADGVAELFAGAILSFAVRYFSIEQKEGNPFTDNGADALKKLGIMTIVLSVVSAAVQTAIFAAFKLLDTATVSNGPEVFAGLLIILFAVVVRYGAELRKNTAEKPAELETEKAE